MQASSQRPLSWDPSSPLQLPLYPSSPQGREQAHSCHPLPQEPPMPPGGRGCFVLVAGGDSLSPQAGLKVGAMSPRVTTPPPASAVPARPTRLRLGWAAPMAWSKVGCGWRPLPGPSESAPTRLSTPHFPLQPCSLGGAAHGQSLQGHGWRSSSTTPAPVNKQLNCPTPPRQEAFLTAPSPQPVSHQTGAVIYIQPSACRAPGS